MTVHYTNICIRELEAMSPIDRAEEILKHRTQGQWVRIMAGMEHAVCHVTDDGDYGRRICRMGQTGDKWGNTTEERDDQLRYDAEFVSRAPDVIRELVDLLKKERTERVSGLNSDEEDL